jgi:hypothetical protein
MSMMPDKKVRKEFQNPSVDIETNLDNNHQVPGKILNEYNLLMDDYFELHYEYSKFKNKPLIQIASKLSKLVPENSKTEHLLQRVIEAFRILSIQGWRELFNRIRIWNRNSKVIKRSIKRNLFLRVSTSKLLQKFAIIYHRNILKYHLPCLISSFYHLLIGISVSKDHNIWQLSFLN